MYRGGSGIGEVDYSTRSPGVCKVTSAGVVTGMSVGNCYVVVSKAGTARYMSALSNIALIQVKNSTDSALNRDTQRNWLIYKQNEGDYVVLINLANRYANSEAELQVRTYARGKMIYKTLGLVTLDDKGDAVFQENEALLKGSRLRLVIQGSNIKYGTTL